MDRYHGMPLENATNNFVNQLNNGPYKISRVPKNENPYKRRSDNYRQVSQGYPTQNTTQFNRAYIDFS